MIRVFPAVLHGNNLLVFGGTGIPFGENNGNDVHVCNVKYKRWSLLNCRGKKPNRIYGQVKTVHTHDALVLHYVVSSRSYAIKIS